ncbi:putative protein TPRXL [Plectropomus leopardus]|uniref:putative protein TPRXL n=1 Tax=Plectropomus leopardus TaxID=160734 RepID=UPI001C4D8368|nr:putative protein TPRXL [Plectropomus leopardus]
MAKSEVSGMKMRNLLFGVILGLLAVVHSTPVDTVTQIPSKAEDEVIREAVTDGFLVEHLFTPSRTTESPKRNTTVPASQQPSADSKYGDVIEGSGDESMTSLFHKFLSTTLNSTLSPQSTSPDHISSSQAPDPASPSNNLGSGDGLHDFSTTSSSTSSTTSSTSTTASPGPKAPVTFSTGEGSGLGSGEGSGSMRFPSNEGSGLGSDEKSGSEMGITTVSTTTKEYPALMNDPFADVNKAKAPRMFVESDKSDDESGSVSVSTKMTKMIEMLRPSKDDVQEPQIGETSNGEIQNKGHSTPGWIIIVGFIVGVAALIMLFVAIATRDK